MIIHSPVLKNNEDSSVISVRIETGDFELDIPKDLWFRVDHNWSKFLSKKSDAFLVAMLPIACEMGENIEIYGDISPKLLYGAREYVRISNAYYPNRNSLIEIKAHNLSQDIKLPTNTVNLENGIGFAFSGGVDAFYTLYSHLPENEDIPEYQITHALTINGFDRDVDLYQSEFFPVLKKIYNPIFDKLNIKYISVDTNLQAFRKTGVRDLTNSYSSSLISSALILGTIFRKFFVSSSYKYGVLGTADDLRPLVDPLLSNEDTEILYAGADATRYERLLAISAWPLTYDHLRVCTNKNWRNIDVQSSSIVNCCNCEKCLLTQIALDLINVSSLYSTFPIQLTRKRIRYTHFKRGSRIRLKEYLRYSDKIGKKDLSFDLRCALYLSIFKSFIKSPKKLFSSFLKHTQ